MKAEKRELDYCNDLSVQENYSYIKNMDNYFDKETDDYLRPKIYKLLPKIDEELGSLEVDLSKRSFIATKELFDKGLIKFRATNGNKLSEELKDKAFSIIHIFVNDWFITKYGNINHDTDMISHIIINGVSYEIKVPLCICKPTGDNETAWLSFPSIIQNDENIISWLKNVPNLNFLSELDIS